MGSKQCLCTIFVYTTFLALAIYPLIVSAAPIQLQSRSTDSSYTGPNVATHGHQKRGDRKCNGFEGDSDTYGLGIRIGLYFQWITTSIAYNFVPSEAITMRGVNNCFQAAMFAGLLYLTITGGVSGHLHAVEAYLMLIFCMGGVCSGNSIAHSDGNGDDHERRSGDDHERRSGDAGGIGSTVVKTGYAYLETSTPGGYVRLLLACGFIAYGLWFVFVGMDGMLNAYPDDCNYAFFLARIDLFGGFRYFLKALFILSAIPALVSLTSGTVKLARVTRKFIFRKGWRGRVNHSPEVSQASHQTPSPPIRDSNERPGLQFHKLGLLDATLSTTLLTFIIAVELTIRWNKIGKVQAIGSTGQLLPVIVGVGGVGRVLMRLISDSLEEAALRERTAGPGGDIHLNTRTR